LAIGCTRSVKPGDTGKPSRPDADLGIKAELVVEPKSLSRSTRGRMTIRVFITNLKDEPLVIDFDTNRYYEVYATDLDGRQYRLERSGEAVITTLSLEAHETKLYEMGWDGYIWSERDFVYLPYGTYELEARVKSALSNTEFVSLRE
jgi:hypothetical protein